MNQRFKKFLSSVLSVIMIALMICPSTSFAKSNNELEDNVISATPTHQQTLVPPDTPIEIVLNASKYVLQTLKIGKNNSKDNFGVLIRDGQNDFLATESNGNAEVVYDETKGIVKITAQHPELKRYTNYDVYLLCKEALNKYNALLNSNYNSSAFEKMLEKQNGTYYHFSFNTGSAVGEAIHWNITQNKEKFLTTEDLTVVATAHDDYGNPATNGKLTFIKASDNNGQSAEITVTPTEAELKNGRTEIVITSEQPQKIAIELRATGGYPEDTNEFNINAEFVNPVPEGSQISVDVNKDEDENIIISGNVRNNDEPVADVGVPLDVTNGTLSDDLPVTDENGNFETILIKEEEEDSVVSVDPSKTSNVEMPTVYIDPTIYGNQAWTDTGIDITSPNTLIKIEAEGSWADNLYAKVETHGTPVKVGFYGGYVTGITGRLYLGPYNTTYEDDIEVIIYIANPKGIGIYPTMNITANPTELPADGKSTSIISGKVLYSQYPLVDGTVNLSATLGTLDNTTPTTDDTGNYSAIFTAGDSEGTAVVNSSFTNLNQDVSIILTPVNPVIPFTASRFSAGEDYTLFIGKNGIVWACGAAYNGKLGTGSSSSQHTPIPVKDLKNIIQVSAGYDHSLALRSDGTVWAWGRNSDMQLGDGTPYMRSTRVLMKNLTDVVQVDAGGKFSLALKKDGTVWICGYYAQVGFNRIGSATPIQIEGLTDVIQIAAGYDHFLALKKDGTVWAIGYNDYGQLGDGTTTDSFITPVQVQGLSDVVQIAAGECVSAALKKDGTVWTWGKDGGKSILTPVQIEGFTDIIKVCVSRGRTAGPKAYYALKNDGTVWYWNVRFGGYGYYGPIYYEQATPAKIEQLENVVDISLGTDFVIAEKEDGSIWVWGHNKYGQLGNGTTNDSPMTPIPFVVNEDLAQDNSIPLTGKGIEAGGNTSFAIDEDGTVWTWGDTYDRNGQYTKTSLPVQLGLTDVKQLAAGYYYHYLALKNDGTVWGWGRNDYGQIGNGTYKGVYTPVQVLDLTDVIQIDASMYSSMALRSDGTVWVWGRYRTKTGWTSKSSPVQVEELSDIVQIAVGEDHFLALKSDGTVWAWGDNGRGQLGNGTTTNNATPTQVAGLTDVVQIAAGDKCSLALKRDGTVWVWGDYILTPTQKEGLTDIVKIDIGGGNGVGSKFYALKEDGTVWYWGTAEFASSTVYSIDKATQMPEYNLADVVDISAGHEHVLALKKDGTIRAWGINKYGQLGDGTNTNWGMYPVQVIKEIN